MDTLYLKTLLAVIETGSFSRAADCLCITQSAVSQRIKLMEGRYGYTLLDRSGGVIVPTMAGELVQQKARIIIEQEKALFGALKMLPQKCHISFCCSPCFATLFLPRILREYILPKSDSLDFKCRHSTTATALQGLREAEYNVIAVEHFSPLRAEPFNVIPLPNDEVIFVSNAKLGLNSEELELSKLLRHQLVLRKEGANTTEQLAANLALFGKTIEDFKGVINLDDPGLIKQTVLTEPCIAHVSRMLVKDEIANGSLRAHTVKGFNHQRYRSLVMSRTSHGDRRMDDFIQAVTKTVQRITSPVRQKVISSSHCPSLMKPAATHRAPVLYLKKSHENASTAPDRCNSCP